MTNRECLMDINKYIRNEIVVTLNSICHQTFIIKHPLYASIGCQCYQLDVYVMHVHPVTSDLNVTRRFIWASVGHPIWAFFLLVQIIRSVAVPPG